MRLAVQQLVPKRRNGMADTHLAAEVLMAQESERRRFSREMHDELAQKVALLEFQIDAIQGKFQHHDEVVAELDGLRGSVATLAGDLHRICHRLHPVVLDRLGLVPGIEYLCSEFSRTTGIVPELTAESLPAQVPSNVSLGVYRLVQEALSNVQKHACAKHVTVTIRGGAGGIRVIVTDTGCGFDAGDAVAKSRLGLLFVSERVNMLGGQSSIRSVLGQGTTIEAFIPLHASHVAA